MSASSEGNSVHSEPLENGDFEIRVRKVVIPILEGAIKAAGPRCTAASASPLISDLCMPDGGFFLQIYLTTCCTLGYNYPTPFSTASAAKIISGEAPSVSSRQFVIGGPSFVIAAFLIFVLPMSARFSLWPDQQRYETFRFGGMPPAPESMLNFESFKTRSPLCSMYSETIAGVTTLRAFGASSKFLRDILRHVDAVKMLASSKSLAYS
ncbi:hypothetical protein DFH09DRAFT_1086189 [Mycena vulgaris]|nr:hypothetical protein DFH09DRAFT_1086189 [Mycena vulgaris]